MADVNIRFNHAKATKGAHRYEVAGEPSEHFPFLKSIYITKEVLRDPDKAPDSIIITAAIADEFLK